MIWKKGLGISLIFIGFYLAFTADTFTGAVIGARKENLLGWVGLIILVLGMFLVLTGRRVRYTLKSLDSILEDVEEDSEAVVVLDSSGIIDYEMNLDDILSKFRGRIYVPRAVEKEIRRDKGLMNRLHSYGKIKTISPEEEPERYQELQKISKQRLERTRKHQDYLKLKKIIGEEVVPKGVNEKELGRYQRMEKEIEERLKEKGYEPNRKNKLLMLEKNYKVSEGDIEVLTTALFNVAHKKQTRILAYDSHIKDATKDLIREFPSLGRYLRYLDYREYQEAA
jgi:hypothetical protein